MIEWGDRSRPVARWVPRPIVRVFDRGADWLDGEVWTIRAHGIGLGRPEFDHKIERWDVLNALCLVACSIAYSLYLGSWLKGLTLGPMMYVLGWMAFRWFV